MAFHSQYGTQASVSCADKTTRLRFVLVLGEHFPIVYLYNLPSDIAVSGKNTSSGNHDASAVGVINR